jgi:hypothetical protein
LEFVQTFGGKWSLLRARKILEISVKVLRKGERELKWLRILSNGVGYYSKFTLWTYFLTIS